MTQSSVFALTLATLIVQQLQVVVARSTQPCLDLQQRIAALTARFLSAPPTPAATLDFEKELQVLLHECGRQIVESVFNEIEPENPQDAPKHTQRDRQDYTRKNHKSRNRGGIATLFGTIELQRCLYEPLQEARDDSQRSFSPLELCLGIVANNATPALAERVGAGGNAHPRGIVGGLATRASRQVVGHGSPRRDGGCQRRYRCLSARRSNKPCLDCWLSPEKVAGGNG